MSDPSPPTHRVAVTAYVYQHEKFLLLKRSQPPLIWVPPGGRLKMDEDPVDGLVREVREETALEIEVLMPANTWFGAFRPDYYLLSIDYLVRVKSGKIRLSSEHSDHRWVSLAELERGTPVALDSPVGFTVADFRNAQKIIVGLGLFT